MKITANEIKPGMIVEHKNDYWNVLKTQHVKPGKGGAFNQVEMKSVNKNTKLNARFRSNENVEKALVEEINSDELLSEFIGTKLLSISTTTREPSKLTGRLTDWLKDDRFSEFTGGKLNSITDRVMICGSMEMLKDHKAICEKAGMVEGSNSEPGHFVIEKAFVD